MGSFLHKNIKRKQTLKDNRTNEIYEKVALNND